MTYPNNRLIVDGVDLTLQYGLILTDGYTIEPPEPKTYEVDIPGGDGKIDLTESLLGDTAYKNRKMEFELYAVGIDDAVEFEKLMTEVKTFLHGKAFDFQITMDPDYTYHGRFTLSNPKHSRYTVGIVGYIKVTVDAEPFKYLADSIYKVDAIGGKIVYFESGRKRIRPTIETGGYLKVIYNNQSYELPQGSWILNDVLFGKGINEVYFNSFDVKNLTWGELKNAGTTWGDFNKKKLFEWYKSNGDGTQVIETWKMQEEKTWADLAEKTWGDLKYMSEVTGNIGGTYVKYKVGEL